MKIKWVCWNVVSVIHVHLPDQHCLQSKLWDCQPQQCPHLWAKDHPGSSPSPRNLLQQRKGKAWSGLSHHLLFATGALIVHCVHYLRWKQTQPIFKLWIQGRNSLFLNTSTKLRASMLILKLYHETTNCFSHSECFCFRNDGQYSLILSTNCHWRRT